MAIRNKTKRHRIKNQHGITLAETLIGIAISVIVMAAIYQAYHFQQKLYVIQDQVAEMQQVLRAGIYVMGREIQMAGYDPIGTAGAGFVANLPSPNGTFGATTDSNIIAFTVDDNGNGNIDDSSSEQIAYRLNNNKVERFIAEENVWRAVADNIETLNFVYLDSDGNPTTVLPDIRSVEISLLAKSKNPDSKFKNTTTYQNNRSENIFVPSSNDHYRRRLLVTRILCRNISL